MCVCVCAWVRVCVWVGGETGREDQAETIGATPFSVFLSRSLPCSCLSHTHTHTHTHYTHARILRPLSLSPSLPLITPLLVHSHLHLSLFIASLSFSLFSSLSPYPPLLCYSPALSRRPWGIATPLSFSLSPPSSVLRSSSLSFPLLQPLPLLFPLSLSPLPSAFSSVPQPKRNSVSPPSERKSLSGIPELRLPLPLPKCRRRNTQPASRPALQYRQVRSKGTGRPTHLFVKRRSSDNTEKGVETKGRRKEKRRTRLFWSCFCLSSLSLSSRRKCRHPWT